MLTRIFCLVVIQNFKTNSLILGAQSISHVLSLLLSKYISCAVPSVVLMSHYAAPLFFRSIYRSVFACFAQITPCGGAACLALFWLTNSHLKTVVSLKHASSHKMRLSMAYQEETLHPCVSTMSYFSMQKYSKKLSFSCVANIYVFLLMIEHGVA